MQFHIMLLMIIAELSMPCHAMMFLLMAEKQQCTNTVVPSTAGSRVQTLQHIAIELLRTLLTNVCYGLQKLPQLT